jgi:hypothetical protein
MLDRWMDAVKAVGTGNSAGLFAAGVSFYYFTSEGEEIIRLLKVSAFVYFIGVVLFTVAFIALTVHFYYQDKLRSKPTANSSAELSERAARWFRGALTASVFSLACWLVGSAVIMLVAYRL